MGKFLFAILAAVASFALVESLVCKNCAFGLFGLCVSSSDETCANTNTSVCYTSKSTFSVLPKFSGFSVQGCKNDDTGCNASFNGTLLGVVYDTNTACCKTDKCNPVFSGAPSTRMTFGAVVGGAVLATVLGSVLS